jgi:threonine synthase
MDGDVEESVCTCGDDGLLDVRYDMEIVRAELQRRPPAARPRGYLRYAELLPLRGASPQLLPTWTPLRAAPALARAAGVRSVRVKDETVHPSASVKDRAAAIALARASALGALDVACSSTGNFAGAIAAAAAAHGVRAHLFVPATAPAAKLRQALAYGADVRQVEEGYEAAYELCVQVAAERGWYDASCARNPYLVEGQKTCGFELAEQTRDGPARWLVVPVGDGCTLVGAWKGLNQMSELGLLDELPRLLAVRAGPGSIAESIAVALPRNGTRARAAVEESGGDEITVGDDAIRAAVGALAAAAGVYTEPAAAASLAGLLQARSEGLIGAADDVVLLATGSGLKAASDHAEKS